MNRLFSVFAAALLLVSVLSLTTLRGTGVNGGVGKLAFAAGDDNWYVGEGAKEDMYVTYRIQDYDTNNGAPYTITIYFDKQDDEGNWIAPTFVVDQGKVINGTMKLSSFDMSVLGSGSQIPDEMMSYVSGYKDSLQWLSAYVAKPGQSLTSASWGKIASIGGPEIKPSGTETITTEAGTFDTAKISYHKSVDNNIWIKDGFPFPIKAETYADVTTGAPPVQYKFELLATGSGRPPAPESTTELPTPPLEQRTARGSYFIDLNWSPAVIKPNTNVTFDVSFYDDSHSPVQDVGYNFRVTDSKGDVISDLTDQFAGNSVGHHTVKFTDANAGPIKVDVKIIAVGSRDPGAFVESATFNIVAGPEFPVGTAAGVLLLTAAIGALVVASRWKGGMGASLAPGSGGARP
ncbi:MAG TPA: hypothetical protein VJP79_12115 [Nitrososphaera sp.]|nr:hypothetical protein [Nitrososphaera sp.]